MPRLGQLARNFSAVTGVRVVTALVSFAFFVLLARVWEPEELGRFATLYALFFILQHIPMLGLHQPVVRDIAQDPGRTRELATNVLALSLVGAVVFGALLVLVGTRVYDDPMHGSIRLLAVALLPCALTATSEVVLMAQERMASISAVQAVESVTRTLAWTVVLLAGGSLTDLFVVFLACRVLAVVLYFTRTGTLRHLDLGAVSSVALRGLAGFVPTFLAIHLLMQVMHRLDFILLSKLGGMDDVGMYSAPYKIYESLLVVPQILTVVLYPRFARLFEESEDGVTRAAGRLSRFSVMAGLPAAITLAFLAEPIMRVVFGAEFVPAARALVWLAVVPVIAAANFALGMALHVSHNQHLDLRTLLVTAGAYGILLSTMIPAWGFVGAAVATALAETLQFAIRYAAVRRTVGVVSLQALLGPSAVAGAAMAACAVVLTGMVGLLPAVALGAVAYVGVLFAARGFTGSDLRDLRGMVLSGSET